MKFLWYDNMPTEKWECQDLVINCTQTQYPGSDDDIHSWGGELRFLYNEFSVDEDTPLCVERSR